MTEYVRVNDFSARRTGVEVPADEDRCVRVEHGVRCPRRKKTPKPRGRTKYCEACALEIKRINSRRRIEEWKQRDPEGALEKMRVWRRRKVARWIAEEYPPYMARRERDKAYQRARRRWLAKHDRPKYEAMCEAARKRYHKNKHRWPSGTGGRRKEAA